MGMINGVLRSIFGGGRNIVLETAQVFRENAESAGVRDLSRLNAALTQHAAEFRATRSGFDTVMDGANRLPRPMLAIGTIGLFVSAMVDPLWFADRMRGLALVPEPLWWLMGAIVSFYFGARHQMKGQQFQRDIAQVLTRVPAVIDNSRPLSGIEKPTEPNAEIHLGPSPSTSQAEEPNAALDAWRALGT